MDARSPDDSRLDEAVEAPRRTSSAESQLSQIAQLLRELEGGPDPRTLQPLVPKFNRAQENLLVQARLGIGGGLYATLQARHEPTARHCLRVAMACSAWASKIGLDEESRDHIEFAALLHDVGKIGIPDAILLKPGALTDQEAEVMDGHWHLGLSILRNCSASSEVMQIVQYCRTWYDGSRGRQELLGDQMPLGTRLIQIVDAFDSMMTDHVYRKALSLERAFHELLSGAGTQFDPSLVILFIKLYENHQLEVDEALTRRWLQELDPEVVLGQWRRPESSQRSIPRTAEALFQQKLLDNMHDAVVFIDSTSRIMLWNRGAERLTGVSSASVQQRSFLPSLVRMRDEKGKLIRDDVCPVAHAMESGVQWMRRLMIRSRTGNDLAVDAHAAPVFGNDGRTLGVTLLLHDASSEITLEERCQSLHELATRDPLTQVANRAEFDRVHELFIQAHQETRRPCCLIICDIDRFKRINDTWGHPAGDAIIQSFAKLLQNAAHPGDLVARYGGEEFVMLCADCDNPSGAARAEELRVAFCELRQPALEGGCASASFGVTEVQPGDTPETMLSRADRGLLLAKETGRNRVVQLGSGGKNDEHAGLATTVTQSREDILMIQDMITQSPVDRTIEKLRGFISDQHGELASVEGRQVQIKLGSAGTLFRRTTDRQVPLLIDLTFEEDAQDPQTGQRGKIVRTRIHVEVRPQRSRDRRKADAVARARQLLISLRAYLMATDVTQRTASEGQVDDGKNPGAVGWIASLFGAKPAEPVDDR